METETETEQLNRFLRKEGADLVGFCSCREYFPEYSSAVVIGVSVLKLLKKSQSDPIQNLNTIMDLLNIQGRQFLCERGFGVWGALFSQEDLPGKDIIPHRELAVKAGLGTIGRNFLVITPEFGPRVQLTTILTTMPVLPSQPLDFAPCVTCTMCVDKCPTGALDSYFRHEECVKCFTCVLECPVGRDAQDLRCYSDLPDIWQSIR